MERKFVVNPLTNKSLLVGSATYRKLVANGTLVHDPQVDTSESESEPEPEKPVRKVLAKQLVREVKKNKSQFVDLSKKETDKLLRKLLLLKLAPKKKVKKRRPKTPPPSSSDESSESESSSSESD